MKLTMFFLYHTLSHCPQPEAPWCVCVYVYKYTCICVCLCARETRVCLSAFCHPAIGDSFNCSMTTTRKDQKPHKSQSKLAAVPQWKASHAIITGKKTSSTVVQNRVYLTPITQLCRYPNNNVICPDRTEVSLRKIWTSWIIKQRLMAGRRISCQDMKTMGETLIFKKLRWIRQPQLTLFPVRRGTFHSINNSFYKISASSEQAHWNILISISKVATQIQ